MAHLRYNPPSGWPRHGRAFNHGIVVADGVSVHVTGQVAWDAEGRLVGAGDCARQAEQCFDNVEAILDAVGSRLEDIVTLTIFFLDPQDLPAIQRVRAARLAPEIAPASVLVQTPGLVARELLVELVPVAVIPRDRYYPPAAEALRREEA